MTGEEKTLLLSRMKKPVPKIEKYAPKPSDINFIKSVDVHMFELGEFTEEFYDDSKKYLNVNLEFYYDDVKEILDENAHSYYEIYAKLDENMLIPNLVVYLFK